MLRDFGRALSEAISDSSEASRKLRQLKDEGYSLYLLLDGAGAASLSDERPPAPPRRLGAGEPQFQIDGQDLSFLRSIGIDPTRRLRRRRQAR